MKPGADFGDQRRGRGAPVRVKFCEFRTCALLKTQDDGKANKQECFRLRKPILKFPLGWRHAGEAVLKLQRCREYCAVAQEYGSAVLASAAVFG